MKIERFVPVCLLKHFPIKANSLPLYVRLLWEKEAGIVEAEAAVRHMYVYDPQDKPSPNNIHEAVGIIAKFTARSKRGIPLRYYEGYNIRKRGADKNTPSFSDVEHLDDPEGEDAQLRTILTIQNRLDFIKERLFVEASIIHNGKRYTDDEIDLLKKQVLVKKITPWHPIAY
ncbi:MAG: hypothetical protein UU67_C0015G0014 [Candidatus Daviesbacteria bacterium GW2011_GWB1_41_5]|uniref:Uncharacterized protein n=1 Tax=Candidatus Daviesbacteria bacterium GW2011_GWB1_41_5 TaxID=1618429 RepID=A0A0G0WP37_9BACT|nr:MAG: hypothetical protein UU67_C0015G0014 [Candidatus Daviesbacteria bacterium GW2011_GWB1_41_5]